MKDLLGKLPKLKKSAKLGTWGGGLALEAGCNVWILLITQIYIYINSPLFIQVGGWVVREWVNKLSPAGTGTWAWQKKSLIVATLFYLHWSAPDSVVHSGQVNNLIWIKIYMMSVMS